MPVQEYLYPRTVAGALALLGDAAHPAAAVAGGSALVRGKRRRVERLVDLARCGLDRVESTPRGWVIGAMVRAHDLVRNPLPGAAGRLLAEAADGIATQPLRNVITVGGNLVRMVAWADLPVALLALDAVAEVRWGERGAGEFALAELARVHPRKLLPAGALVTGVRVPRAGAGEREGATYRRFRTSEVDYSLVSVAAVVSLAADGRIARAAIALGAVTPRPRRCPGAEALLGGRTPSAGLCAEAARRGAEEVEVSADFRLAGDLRRRILEVEMRRAIAVAVARAGGAA